ncbi:Peptidyl-tRNA hydrolase [[Clostridium] cellulosi]|uniref:Peptidyl-tRNA hydrolase n=1 Tax=[Clostridium] cellulosi TaxID=29343 RepID=A0A078KTV9_9FIRM|nr:Peptidyl-tRNA hydrolase [[Clostridium] cellulosi]
MFGIKRKKDTEEAPGRIEYIIAGLGNPGREYEGTRHNTGFAVLDAIAEKCGAKVNRIKFKSLCGDAMLCGHRVLLLKPQTFMNLSGEAIRDAADFYKIPMDHVIVLYDDISLPPGKIRVRPKGSDGGHNGIKNIIYLSGTDVFPRVKVGVGGKPNPDYDLAAWVLARPSEEDAALISDAVTRAVAAVETIITDGTAKAMNDFN